jgi:hypothetical protein
MYEQITGESFLPGGEPMVQRIEKNLQPYAI